MEKQIQYDGIFAILCGSLITVLAFQLDRSIGAIGTSDYYFGGMIITDFIILIFTAYLLHRWNFLNDYVSAFFILTLSLALFFWPMAMLLAMALVIFLPLQIIPIVLFVVIFGWVATKLRFLFLPQTPLKVLVIFILIFSAFYVTGSGIGFGGTKTLNNVTTNNKQYILQLHYGVFEGDQLFIYECNTLALFCSQIYGSEHAWYRDQNVQLVFNAELESLNVFAEGQILFAQSLHPRQ